jgi:hypothetical protein
MRHSAQLIWPQTVALCLVAMLLPKNLACSAAETPDIDYFIKDTNRTPTEVREIRTHIGLNSLGQGFFRHEEIIHGSLAQTAQDAYIENITRDIKPEHAQNLYKTLTHGNFFGLKSDVFKTSGEINPTTHSEFLVVSGTSIKQLSFRSEPNSEARKKLRSVMFDFCTKQKIDQPPFLACIKTIYEGDKISPRKVEIKDLIAHPEEFQGKRVSVRGFYR